MLPIVKFRPPMPTLAGMGAVREGQFPCKYTVALYQPGASNWGGFLIGHVVTYLSIYDWCALHGYELIDKETTSAALSHERTILN